MTRTRTRLLALALAVTAAAACGGGGDDKGSTADAADPTTTVAPDDADEATTEPEPADARLDGSDLPEACALLTQAVVAEVFDAQPHPGESPFTLDPLGEPAPDGIEGMSMCHWPSQAHDAATGAIDTGFDLSVAYAHDQSCRNYPLGFSEVSGIGARAAIGTETPYACVVMGDFELVAQLSWLPRYDPSYADFSQTMLTQLAYATAATR